MTRTLSRSGGGLPAWTMLGRPAAGLLALCLLLQSSACSLFSEKRNNYQFQHTFAVSDPAFRRSLDTFGNSMTEGNRAELLNNGDEIFPAMLGAIQGAKVSVNLESYIYKNDEVGKRFAAALSDAARRGVEVRVLVDGTGGRAGALLPLMKQAGVKAYIYHPIRLWSIYNIAQRTHRKILVVDGAVCFTGGVGIEDRWLGNARNPKEWRDTQVRAEGPVAAQMQAIFSEDWTFTTGEILAGNKFYPPLGPSGSLPAQAIKVSRGDSTSLSKMLYYVAIQSAVSSIHIQNAYFLPDRQMRAALVAAARRGVDVKIMVPGPHIDVAPVRQASRIHYGELLQSGVKIYEYIDTMLHSKNAVVDSLFSSVGSINFDVRSMQKNAEENMVFYDPGFAARLEAVFADDLQHCHEITYDRWVRRGFHQKVFELLSWFFEPFY